MPHQSNYSFYYLSNNIWLEIQSKELVVLQYSTLPFYLVIFRPKYLVSTLFSNTLSPPSSLSKRDQVPLPCITTGTLIVLRLLLGILICIFLDSKLKTNGSAPNDNKHSLNSNGS